MSKAFAYPRAFHSGVFATQLGAGFAAPVSISVQVGVPGRAVRPAGARHRFVVGYPGGVSASCLFAGSGEGVTVGDGEVVGDAVGDELAVGEALAVGDGVVVGVGDDVGLAVAEAVEEGVGRAEFLAPSMIDCSCA